MATWRTMHKRARRDPRIYFCPGCDVGQNKPGLCGYCVLRLEGIWGRADDDWDNADYNDEDDWELAMGECGQTPHDGCTLAGTEHCDFDCPFRDEDLFEDDDE